MVRTVLLILAAACVALLLMSPSGNGALLVPAFLFALLALVPSGRAFAKICFVLAGLSFAAGLLIPFTAILFWPAGIVLMIPVGYQLIFGRRAEQTAP